MDKKRLTGTESVHGLNPVKTVRIKTEERPGGKKTIILQIKSVLNFKLDHMLLD